MSKMADPTAKEQALRRIASVARDYFAARDDLEATKDELLDAILDATERTGATQQEIADVSDFSEEDGDTEHKFHRTRIQQFLREARRNG